MLKSPMVFRLSCQTLLLQFHKRELRAVFLWKRAEMLPWYRCLYHNRERLQCQQLASLLAASEKQPNSWRLNKSPTAQVHPSRAGLKHIRGPCRGSCSAPVTPFIHSLPELAQENSISPKIWGLGTRNARSLFNINYLVRYVQENYFSTARVWLCQN